MLKEISTIFTQIVGYGILMLEVIGAAMILVNGVRALILCLKNERKKSRLVMAEGITQALSFLLGSEVLHTIVAPDWEEVGLTCAILLMRAGVMMLLQWERKTGE